MNHDRIRAYIDEARQQTTRALAVLSDHPDLDNYAEVTAAAQAWTALANSHAQLTVALAFVNADASMTERPSPVGLGRFVIRDPSMTDPQP